jgi:hypothetical protein
LTGTSINVLQRISGHIPGKGDPAMIEEPLSIEHQPLLQPLLKSLGLQISEYSFANLYLFRQAHAYAVIREAGEIFIRGRAYDGASYIMPTRPVSAIDQKLLRQLIRVYGMLFPIPEAWLECFPDPEYHHSYHEAESDYIHELAKLVTYHGHHLHDKKNLLHQFEKSYEYQAVPLKSEHLADARSILAVWQTEATDSPERTDYHACAEALDRYEELGQCGAIYYVNQTPAGFIIGEELDPSLFALHFVKASRRYKGIYQYMYHQFASIMPARYVGFNFEQDLGIESLRRAKGSYLPERMIRKYRVTL